MLQKLFAKSLFAFCIVFIPVPIEASIAETQRFEEILPEVDQQTLVLFDIDDTLINTTSMLGNTPWWSYFITKISAASLPDSARPDTHAVIQKILQKVPMVLIDPRIEDMIRKLQTKGILTFALTARCIKPDYNPAADRSAYEHLKSVGIDFTQTHFSKKVDTETSCFFGYGIIFTEHQEKGPFLKIFLNNMDLHPAKVVFIDDNMKQVKSVKKAVETLGIPFVGFRYNKLDNFHAKFDPLIANIQLEALIKQDQVLSDEEALKIAHSNPGLASDYFINELIQKWQGTGACLQQQ